jgi:hypothetical protein
MAGYYNRLDIFSVHVRRTRPEPAYFAEMRAPVGRPLESEPDDGGDRAAAE